ncbi:MAG: glycosyltransferase family 2 protein [Pseudomonadota bacterium]
MASELHYWLYNRCVVPLIGGVLPVRWFGPTPPDPASLTPAAQPVKLEIVAHCWHYAHLLAYQLHAVHRHTPDTVDLTYTLYFCESDRLTVDLINHYGTRGNSQVHWNWHALPEAELKRRAIGRNRSALATEADWIWFADCDLIFHEGCLASLATALRDRRDRLVYPASECITPMLDASDPVVNVDPRATPEPTIDTEAFSVSPITKAKGAFQIVHGDVARHCGYCPGIALYQQPSVHWRKTFEDTAFRQLIRDQGTAVDVRGLHRIRHKAKGRYRATGWLPKVRQTIRSLKGH